MILELNQPLTEMSKRQSAPLLQALRLCTGRTASHAPVAIYPRERPGTHCTEGWVGPRAGLDRCGKSCPHRDSIPGP
jgi:hypothetical protein